MRTLHVRTGCDRYVSQSDLLTHRVLQDVVIHVKVGRVSGRGHVGHVRRLSRTDVVPVDPAEEGVALEVGDPVQTEAAFPRAQQTLDQVFGVFRHVTHMGRKLEPVLETAESASGRHVSGMGEDNETGMEDTNVH